MYVTVCMFELLNNTYNKYIIMKNSYAAYYKSKAYSQKYMQIFVCKCNVVIVMRHQQPIVTNKLQVLEFST